MRDVVERETVVDDFFGEALEAIGSKDPPESLHNLYLKWRSQGLVQDVVEARMLSVLDKLTEEEREDEADAVRDSLDLVVGWCNQDKWIFNPERS